MTLKLTTLPQQTQTALPVRLGGSGLQSAMTVRAAAWVGSWMSTLPQVRSLVGPARAAREVVTQGTASWAVELRAAVASLAQQGAYLDQTGGVVAAPPSAAWAWEDGAPALLHRQRGLTR